MGLLFLCPDMEMPFGPTKKEIFEMQHDPAATAVVRKSMISSHNAWVSHAESVLLDLSNYREGTQTGTKCMPWSTDMRLDVGCVDTAQSSVT